MLNYLNKKFTVFFLFVPFLITSIPLTTTAQSEEDGMRPQAVIKMSSLAPAVGASFQVGNQSKLRVLGFFSTDFYRSGVNNSYFIDFSYIRYNNWIESESVKTYWGVDLNFQFQDLITAPGLLAGATYNLSEKFAIFGEAGLNVYIYNEGADGVLGMYNTGVGVKLAL